MVQLCLDYLVAYPLLVGTCLCVPVLLLVAFLYLIRSEDEPKPRKSKKKKKEEQREKKESKKEKWSITLPFCCVLFLIEIIRMVLLYCTVTPPRTWSVCHTYITVMPRGGRLGVLIPSSFVEEFYSLLDIPSAKRSSSWKSNYRLLTVAKPNPPRAELP